MGCHPSKFYWPFSRLTLRKPSRPPPPGVVGVSRANFLGSGLHEQMRVRPPPRPVQRRRSTASSLSTLPVGLLRRLSSVSAFPNRVRAAHRRSTISVAVDEEENNDGNGNSHRLINSDSRSEVRRRARKNRDKPLPPLPTPADEHTDVVSPLPDMNAPAGMRRRNGSRPPEVFWKTS